MFLLNNHLFFLHTGSFVFSGVVGHLVSFCCPLCPSLFWIMAKLQYPLKSFDFSFCLVEKNKHVFWVSWTKPERFLCWFYLLIPKNCWSNFLFFTTIITVSLFIQVIKKCFILTLSVIYDRYWSFSSQLFSDFRFFLY